MKHLIMLLFFYGAVIAQVNYDSVFILPKLKIYDRKDYVSFEKHAYNKFILTDTLLMADPKRYAYSIPVKDINMISFRSGRDFWGGAKVGAIAGFALGFVFWGFWDWDPHPKFHTDQAFLGGLITAVPFGLIGGLIGLLGEGYDDYDLKKIPNGNKYTFLRRVFKKKQVY